MGGMPGCCGRGSSAGLLTWSRQFDQGFSAHQIAHWCCTAPAMIFLFNESCVEVAVLLPVAPRRIVQQQGSIEPVPEEKVAAKCLEGGLHRGFTAEPAAGRCSAVQHRMESTTVSRSQE